MFQIGRKEYAPNIVPLHRHRCYEIIAYFQGNGTIHTSTGDVPVETGSIVIVPPGVSHSTTPENGLQSMYILGDFGGIFHFDQPAFLLDNTEGEGLALIKMIYRNRNESGDYVAALCNALAHFLLRNLTVEDTISRAVRKIVYEITENFHDDRIDLNELLIRSGYAEDYIRAHFRRITGKTPTAFLNDLRVKRACYLIEVYHTTLSLTEIAAQCGYTDYVLFSKRFKSVMGVSPRRYRGALEYLPRD